MLDYPIKQVIVLRLCWMSLFMGYPTYQPTCIVNGCHKAVCNRWCIDKHHVHHKSSETMDTVTNIAVEGRLATCILWGAYLEQSLQIWMAQWCMAYLGYPAAKSIHTNLWQNIKVPNQSKSRMRSLPTCWGFHEGCSIIKKKTEVTGTSRVMQDSIGFCDGHGVVMMMMMMMMIMMMMIMMILILIMINSI